ncbi:hypothetical protein FQB35_09495 [Crassaminicella thermophila]|uniref:Uncharacterized protein n=1 Tax=Crassaminicella thermophila TaxID=2599308 RepID=A0A5C0SH30_CRATE|nr:Mur ligase family protein [Crassaminicella thermophila]QEK12538.1 hypothetical protein FQB35_09495 [Crassaminicella thermophila]
MLIEGVEIKKNDKKELAWHLYNKKYDYPFEKIKIVGVIGTNGKTTTAKIIYHILKEHGQHVGFLSCEEVWFDEEKIKTSWIYCDTEHVFKYFDKMIKKGIQIVVMKVDNYSFKEAFIYGIKFDALVYTNIETEYINHEGYLDIQNRIGKHLSENGVVIVNTDNKNNSMLLEDMKNRLMITYGLCSKATITASSIDSTPSIRFNCCIQRGITARNDIEIDPMEFPVSINLLGKHNVYNTLAAIAATLIYGVLPEDIVKAFQKFKGIKRRMYRIYNDVYQIIDDMSHDPPSYEALFETIQSIDYENLYIVNAIIGNGGVDLNKNNALLIANWMKAMKSTKMITTSSVDTVDENYKVLDKEKEIFHKIFEEDEIVYEHKDRLKDALELALLYAGKNDLILLLGGHGMDEGENLVNKLLKEKN